MKSKFLSIVLLCFLFLSCQGQQAKEVQTLDAKSFSEKLNSTPNAQIVDVRTPEEYEGEHLDNAVNMDWFGDDFAKKVTALDKSKPIFVYCKVGGRSAKASNKLAALGFKEIYNLDGGIMRWNATGYGKPSSKVVGMCDEEFDVLIKSDKKVLVDFYAEWCAPCKKMAPYLIKMQNDMKGKMPIVRLDADKNKTLVTELKLDSLPVVILYENGKEVWRNTGFISEEDLKKHL
ncbi:thioredoxin domain-containing protein [Flavobacterium sp.]|uniref:thioredoxin domain-containing protein n=1 Tax=Flavobacterium sp. TaxID=239 RepID=UPI002FDA0B87